MKKLSLLISLSSLASIVYASPLQVIYPEQITCPKNNTQQIIAQVSSSDNQQIIGTKYLGLVDPKTCNVKWVKSIYNDKTQDLGNNNATSLLKNKTNNFDFIDYDDKTISWGYSPKTVKYSTKIKGNPSFNILKIEEESKNTNVIISGKQLPIVQEMNKMVLDYNYTYLGYDLYKIQINDYNKPFMLINDNQNSIMVNIK